MSKSPVERLVWDRRLREASSGLASALSSGARPEAATVLRPLIRAHRPMLILGILLNALHGVAVALQNLAPKWLISDVLKPPDLTLRERFGRAALLAVAYLVVSIGARMLVWHLSYRIFSWVRERMVFVLRHRFFRHVNALCLRFHMRHSSGEMFNFLFGSPISQFIQFFQHSSLHLPGALMTIVFTLAVVGLWDPWLTAVLFLTALGAVAVMQVSRKRVRVLHRDFQAAEGAVSASVADVLRGNKAVKLYAMEQTVSGDFDREAQWLGWMSYNRDIKAHIENMKYEGVTYVAYAVLVLTATWRYMGGHVDEGVVAAYLNSFGGVVGPLAMMFTASTLWGSAEASIERIGTVLNTGSTTPDPEDGAHQQPGRGALELRRVTFRYEGTRNDVLQDFSLSIPYGCKAALVGPSGSGKSTISQLMLRLYDPDDGQVLIDGVDLRRVRGADIRRLFGVVPQDPFIFRTTVAENVKVSRPDASRDEIIDACRRANAWEFIERLPGQLDEQVGEGGSSLSGGQRQRLAIARALLADPPYLIFDEATSALDSISEELIRDSLERELGDRTAIFIAHRLSTVRNCDLIFVLDGGRIVEQGTYQDLIARGGLFKRMVDEQKLGVHPPVANP